MSWFTLIYTWPGPFKFQEIRGIKWNFSNKCSRNMTITSYIMVVMKLDYELLFL